MQADEIKDFSRKILRIQRDLDSFRSLIKTDAGRLSAAGLALLREALRVGMQHAKIARLLEITPAAVAYHDR